MTDLTAIVTGSGSGIGQSTAIALARKGYRVALVGRRLEAITETAECIQKEGLPSALLLPGDVSQPDQATDLAEHSLKEFGHLDVLVNNAAINVRSRSVLDTNDSDWSNVLNTNLMGAVHLIRAIVPRMATRRSGTVVNVGSDASRRVYLIAGPAYTASKYALRSLTEFLNLEMRDRGVRSCLVMPGEVATPLLRNRPKDAQGSEHVDKMLSPEDVADTIVFVASLPPRAIIEEVVLRPAYLSPAMRPTP